MWPYHPELLARPVPRYTSFPTAAEFTDSVGAAEQGAGIDAMADAPVSLYLHIPYCDQICWYCGCNTGAANRSHRLTSYLDSLGEEIDLVAARLGGRGTVSRIAFGGGSPNAIPPVAFVRLLDRVITAFGASAPALSVEIDPRGFSDEWAKVLGGAGVANVSLGVQTFSEEIQHRIGRIQPAEMIERTVDGLRGAGVSSINFDLMYGLPGQDMAVLDATLDATLGLAPERIALFGYAHVPHLLPRQRRIDASALPGQEDRFRMAAHGFERLAAAGYRAIGFDHFALPDDPMARADEAGELRRNFQGFTDDPAETLLGMGASAISMFPDRIVQNEKNAGRYRMRLSQRQLPGAHGLLRSPDDCERAVVIADILCNRPADIALVRGTPGAMEELARFIDLGLVTLAGDMLCPTDATRPYARTIAALFDPYRAQAPNRFSSAV
jgi:oxygen-independent coproporphyrinogen-3 oxidase